MATQWRHGFGGPTGLDYTAVLAVLRDLVPDDTKRRSIFDDIQIMERAAMRKLAEQRDTK